MFADGRMLRAVLKDVSPSAQLAEARRARPAFLLDPRREIEVYRNVLRPFDLGAPAMLGALADEPLRRYVLLLEKVTGVPLWQVGEPEVWCAAARWLAAMHVRLQPAAPDLLAPARLLPYDDVYYARWRARAEAILPGRHKPTETRRLIVTYAAVVPRLLGLPRTFIHGEFHASNVIVETGASAARIRPVDWEMAAFAPALMDLADLTAGRWTASQRETFASDYRNAAVSRGFAPGAHFEYELDCCRLHRAIQWLCWSSQWSPPREHTQDWFGEAMRLCDRIAESTAHGDHP